MPLLIHGPVLPDNALWCNGFAGNSWAKVLWNCWIQKGHVLCETLAQCTQIVRVLVCPCTCTTGMNQDLIAFLVLSWVRLQLIASNSNQMACVVRRSKFGPGSCIHLPDFKLLFYAPLTRRARHGVWLGITVDSFLSWIFILVPVLSKATKTHRARPAPVLLSFLKFKNSILLRVFSFGNSDIQSDYNGTVCNSAACRMIIRVICFFFLLETNFGEITV